MDRLQICIQILYILWWIVQKTITTYYASPLSSFLRLSMEYEVVTIMYFLAKITSSNTTYQRIYLYILFLTVTLQAQIQAIQLSI